jgi:hypothetical protein
MTTPPKLFVSMALGILLSACGGGTQGPPPGPRQLTAAEEVLRIGSTWVNIEPLRGILSPPSDVSVFNTLRKSEVVLSADSATETLIIEESLELRAGGKIECQTEFNHSLTMRWGRRKGEAALELVRPPVHGPRSCSAAHPEGDLSEQAKRAIFVLRSDNLVAVEPLVDQRNYTPGQL